MAIAAFVCPPPVFRAVDNNGEALIGGLLYTYAAGTSTPIATYVDSTAITPNANPVVLNSRGEANVWLPPNVGYKFVLTDQYGSLIWTEDFILNSQLITLYGGVDTGAVNAYDLNFNANFSSLVDGIYLIWYPAHTNSGPVTINVNGLGNVAIVNADGSALIANEIVANMPTFILFKGGQWILTNPNASNQATIKFKPVATSRTTTVVADDPDLTFAIQAVGTYLIEVRCNFNSGGSIAGADLAGYQFCMNFSGTYTVGSPSGNYTSDLVSAVIPKYPSFFYGFNPEVLIAPGVSWASRPSDYVNYTIVFTATSTGTLSVQWAQAAATFTTHLREGSYMHVTKIA